MCPAVFTPAYGQHRLNVEVLLYVKAQDKNGKRSRVYGPGSSFIYQSLLSINSGTGWVNSLWSLKRVGLRVRKVHSS